MCVKLGILILLIERWTERKIMKPGIECCPTLCSGFFLLIMEKAEILEALEELYGTSNPLDVPEPDRWMLYENFKSNIRNISKDPDDYTRHIITISEALEL